MIEIEGLSLSYGSVAAVRALSLAVGRGEARALGGESGRGKTTVLRGGAGLPRGRAAVGRG